MIPHENTGFKHLGLAPKMLELLESMDFVKPTPIQHKAIPVALEGNDVVGIAQTGTGKTMAFGIPMVQRLMSTGGKALVLVPTRELALQVRDVLFGVAKKFDLKVTVLIGGAPMGKQTKALRNDPAIIIATPGRLIDHLENKKVKLQDVSMLVLDEADRMFDMGFKPQVEKIVKSVPRDRQTMLFSATMPQAIVDLAAKLMKLPIQVEIAPSGTAAESVNQELFIVSQEKKKEVLLMLLEQYRGSVLIFTRTKNKARAVNRFLRQKGHKSAEIHSDRSMGQRKTAINGFKSGAYRILVATDVAARGIDVTGIELVINHDLPDEIENYVHRIGRTGRAKESGFAVSLARPDQRDDVQRIERLIRKQLPRMKHPDFEEHEFAKPKSAKSQGRGRGRGQGGGRGKGKSNAVGHQHGGKSRRSKSHHHGAKKRNRYRKKK